MKARHTFAVGDRVIWGTGGDDCMGVVESLTPAGRPRVRGRTRYSARFATPQEWADYVASCGARKVVRSLSPVDYAWLSQITAVDRAALAHQLRMALAELERIEQARAEVTL